VLTLSLPKEIRHDVAGFQVLVKLIADTKDCWFESVQIDMASTTWFDADMSAAFGALLHRLHDNLNTVELINITPAVSRILCKNGFLSHYGQEKIPDQYGTTIQYRRFDIKDERAFAEYINRDFIRRSELPIMSSGVLKKFQESILEIFSNSVFHSCTKQGVFSCGQFFPARNALNFVVADLGIGIRQNIKERRGVDLPADKAIDWVTRPGHTTRKGPIPGGLGLKLLQKFIDANQGTLLIVSDAGYWRRSASSTVMQKLDYPFPGTLVSIEINTADRHSYRLVSEPRAGKNIF
jgi:hypothetical protein